MPWPCTTKSLSRSTSCNHLASDGWLYAPSGSAGDASGYDTPRALYPADLLAWVQATQPQAWETLTKNHGAAAPAMLLDRPRKALDERGTLEVLRVGTRAGKQFRLCGKDIKGVRANYPGDLYCHVIEGTPVKLTEHKRKLFKELDESLKKGGATHSPSAESWTDRHKSFFS